jgi:predicted DNA-binding transcriptional regulator YafY
VNAETLSRIAGACRDSEKITFGYQSRDGAASDREVEPHRLVNTGRRWYLAAWDVTRNNWRTFRVDRMGAGISTGSRFSPRQPPDGDFAAYVSRSVGYEPYPHRATVVLRAPLKIAAKRIPAAIGVLETIDAHSCLLRTGGGSLDSLSVYLALLGFEFEVREPPELIERIRALGDRFSRAVASA